MAGEWEALAWFLAERAGDEAPAIYSHIIQSTNQGDPCLPEEVLALANAAPGEPTNWQIDVLVSCFVAPRSDPPSVRCSRAFARARDSSVERMRRTTHGPRRCSLVPARGGVRLSARSRPGA